MPSGEEFRLDMYCHLTQLCALLGSLLQRLLVLYSLLFKDLEAHPLVLHVSAHTG